MGWPLETVNAMTEHEFTLWMVRGPLWPRRIELLLIQLTTVLAQVNGNKKRMTDFDLFAKVRNAFGDEAAQELGNLAGAGVRRLGMGRRRG